VHIGNSSIENDRVKKQGENIQAYSACMEIKSVVAGMQSRKIKIYPLFYR
jgi:hypothetical protein